MTTDPRRARTRARVLAAAYELLTEVGFDGVTVDLVSERSGVARSTLYRHWTSKQEILRDAFAAVSASPRERAQQGSGAQARLADYAAAFAEGLTGVWGRAAATLAITAFDDPQQREVQRTFTDGTRRDLSAVLADAVAGVELDARADLEDLVDRLEELVIAPLFYRYLFSDRPATAADARRIAASAWHQITRS